MDEFEKYSSLEAYEVAAMAKEKGLILLEGDYQESAYESFSNDGNKRGYCVSKVIAGEYLTLWEDGTVHQEYIYDGPSMSKTVWFRLTLDEAKEQIINFDGTIKNPPNYFAYVRVYEDEPEYCAYLQILYLEEFAHEYGITYKERFVCIGGKELTVWHPEDGRGIDDILVCCEESFNKMDKDSYLVITSISRLNDNIDIWRQAFDIISLGYNPLPVPYENMGYTKYEYHESAELQKVIQKYEQDWIDREYKRMTQEHREMMLQDDQPWIEMEEEYD